MAKRRIRLSYVPNSRRRYNASTKSQSFSTSKREEKKSAKKKRRTNEQLRPSNLKGTETVTSSSAKRKLSPQKVLTSPKAQGKRGHRGAASQKNEASRDRRTLERIRDMTVTRRAYLKWRLPSASTRKYTNQVVESAVLSVLNSVGQESNKKELHFHLKQLSERILTQLQGIKGPPHKGDYSKMEAESIALEDEVISYINQVDALERELAKQKRLLENDEQMLNSYNNKEQEDQYRTLLHPLLQAEPVNALNLPTLTQDAYSTHLLEVPVELEASANKLAQSLIKLNQQTEELGFSCWLEAVLETASDSS